MGKGFGRILKNRNFLFCILVYPLAYCIYLYTQDYFAKNSLSANIASTYSTLSFLVFAFLTILAIWELFDKRLLHKRQGDKLRMKQHQKDWRN